MPGKLLKKILPLFLRREIARRRQQRAFDQLGRKPPELMWEACAPSAERRAESVNVQIGHEIFLIGGYQTIDRVLSVIQVFDLRKQRWTRQIAMPPEMPQTHFGAATDEKRFIYLAGGQLGPRCSPAVTDCFVFDLESETFSALPPLPEARYGLVLQFWRGKLHALSGALPDRSASCLEHLSLAVTNGKATEQAWRQERPIPRGGPHRASALVSDKLYLLGGQDGDLRPLAGDPLYTCDYTTPLENLYPDSWMLENPGEEWKSISPMPFARTHTEAAVTIGSHAVLVGGNEGRLCVSDLIQVYDLRSDTWKIAGRLPFCMKTTAAFYDGWLYSFAGQRARSDEDLRPGEVTNWVWRARFDPEQ